MSQNARCTALAAAAGPLSILLLGAGLILAVTVTHAGAEEPGRARTTGYPAVEDVPPRPEKPAMTADEQSKLKKELGAARDRQAAAAKARGAARAEPVKP
jgi:hypothetical protein